jgi:hypothetical protein
VLWAVGSLNYLVIECKSGATGDHIWRSAVEQLAHSMNWFTDTYDVTCRATAVLVHKLSMLANNASAPPGTRIITASKLEELRTAIRAAATALGDAGNWSDPGAVAAQLSHHKLIGTSVMARYAVPTRRP